MKMSSVRFWHFQSRTTAGVRRKAEFGWLWQKVFYASAPADADPKVVAVRDKLLYCEHLDHELVSMKYSKRDYIRKREHALDAKAKFERAAYQPVFSVMLNNREEKEDKHEEEPEPEPSRKRKPVHMPYAMVDSFELTDSTTDGDVEAGTNLTKESLQEASLGGRAGDVGGLENFLEKARNAASRNDGAKGELRKVPSTWMTDYEQFDDALLNETWYNSHGTPDPSSQVSCVPCGGCGALLHCKDPALPGYLPSELFSDKGEEDLKSMVCQRCHFLKFYNAALEVKVSAEDYPKLLSVVKRRKCAIILTIDLTDFPCSIWPDLKSIMHPFTPVFLVGNKVDLLPRDCPAFFENVKQQLLETVVGVTGIKRENVTHVQLTSAKTGYGIEQLINKLQHKWSYKGDVYLVGCTNVGKSSLFNALVKSDYCKVQAADLVQRATVSTWPGTTLSLLKFPILNPTGKKLFLRVQRLQNESFYRQEEARYRDHQFKDGRNIELATLEGYVGRTFSRNSSTDPTADSFLEKPAAFMSRAPVFDESHPEYEQSRWCYDTPGTIQSDQILDLLTTDELLLTVPRRIISPRTFIFKPRQTVFVAGMGRLDYLEGEYFVKCTLFASNDLPITICHTADADQLYPQLLESKAFAVPTNDSERLKVWPKLESKALRVTGTKGRSAADVVLSSIGWIAVTPQEDEKVLLKAWTPQGRGIHLRIPALLGRSVFLRGPRVQGTPMFMLGRQVYVNAR